MTNQEQINSLHERIDALSGILDIEAKRRQVEQLQEKTLAPDFWNDPKAAEAFMKKMNSVKSWVTAYDKAFSGTEDLDVLLEFARESLSGLEDEAAETRPTDRSGFPACQDAGSRRTRRTPDVPAASKGTNRRAIPFVRSRPETT